MEITKYTVFSSCPSMFSLSLIKLNVSYSINIFVEIVLTKNAMSIVLILNENS